MKISLNLRVSLLLLLDAFLLAVVQSHSLDEVGSGRACSSNFECFDLDGFCALKDNNQRICFRKPKGYFNRMFQHLIRDPEGVVPLRLLEPKSPEMCKTDADCEALQFCSSSTNMSFPKIPLRMRVGEADLLQHCYEISDSWTHKAQFCNSDADCSNNHCLVKQFRRIVDLKMKRMWKADEVTIYSPLFFGRKKMIMKSVDLTMSDEKENVWSFGVNGSDLYYWSRKRRGCSFSFRGPSFNESPPSTFSTLKANFTCNNITEDGIHEDIDIFGGYFYYSKKYQEFDGICGHPGLECRECLIDGKLFKCTQDTDCYKVGRNDWIERNQVSSCSFEKYDEQRLCKRETRRCPIDSLKTTVDSVGGRICETDSDCVDMKKYTSFEDVERNTTYHPHCFNKRCCARRTICPTAEFPYSFPVESLDGREQRGCLAHEECALFPEYIGVCVEDKIIKRKLAEWKKKYLGAVVKDRLQRHGMCCYERNEFCPTGIPQKSRDGLQSCRTHADCNENLPSYEWTAYCSGSFGDWKCCKESKAEAMCPNSYIPYRTELKCRNVQPHSDLSGVCPKENGMCYKGHCCPRHKTDSTELVASYHNDYETEIECNPSEPLDLKYRFAYCNEATMKVIIMGVRKWNGEPLDWKRKRCEINSDCGSPNLVCAHKISSLRFCVTPPSFSAEIENLNGFPVLIIISTIVFPILMIITLWAPVKPFVQSKYIG